MSRPNGHIALVTGGARGIGQAFARRLADDGASVAVVDREDSSETASFITRAGGTAHAFITDITDPLQVADLKDQVDQELGTVDILVNNAGIYPSIPFTEITLEDWRQIFQVNVEGPFLLTKAFLPAMRGQGWGRIISTGSSAVALKVPDLTHYIASKMALIGLTRGIATEAGTDGVTANLIAPSSVRTPGTAATPEEAFQGLAQMQAIPHVQTPNDLVGALAFLASEDAGFLTGQTIHVDGGMVRSN